VLVQLVNERLETEERQSCLGCENRAASALCHDCKEHYCDGCSKMHAKQRATKDHVMQTLPHGLRNTSSSSAAQAAVMRPRTAVSSSSVDTIRNVND
jgi:hypothetical protein